MLICLDFFLRVVCCCVGFFSFFFDVFFFVCFFGVGVGWGVVIVVCY